MAGVNNPRRANGHRRNQLMARVKARDTHCWYCTRPLDYSLTMSPGKHGKKCPGNGCTGCVPHPRRPEVHELIPVSRGGSPYDPTNCVVCCRVCNNKIGNRTPAELAQASRPTIQAVETGVRW